MKLSPTLLTISTLLLVGCSQQTTSISEQNANPLVASRYYAELADTLANFIIQKDKFTEAPGVVATLQREIAAAKDGLSNADGTMAQGMKGAFISMKSYAAGYGLLLGNTFYLSSDFETKPGVNLHLYLTSAVDPRDVTFPDPGAVDLGVVQSAYGAQTYSVPSQKKEKGLRTAVLWDKDLKLLYAFAQLSK